jgi:hypothetical protein
MEVIPLKLDIYLFFIVRTLHISDSCLCINKCNTNIAVLWKRLLWNTCVTNNHGYVPLAVNTSRPFPHSWLITGFVTRLTRRVSLVEQKLSTIPDNLSSPPIFSGVHVTRSLGLCVCFVDRCLSFCPSLIYGFRILFLYLQTLLRNFR